MPPYGDEGGEKENNQGGEGGNDGGDEEVDRSAGEDVEADDGHSTGQKEQSASAARKRKQTESISDP